jgi:PTH1 family peptidyl-tRNA hydrolase
VKLIVGLGNPGPRYASNRHNVGFQCVVRMAGRYGSARGEIVSKAHVTPARIGDVDVVLARPLTFMNLSGQTVSALLCRYGVALSDLLVIYDDLDLPLGGIRLRQEGGSGGHKGMLSIIKALGTESFPRLRIGIGRPVDGEPSDYVLSDFASDEIRVMEETYDRAIAAAESFVVEGIVAAMNTYNTTREPPERVRQTTQKAPGFEPDQSA